MNPTDINRPVRFPEPNPPTILNELLTRRDAFAAAALTGMLARPVNADDDWTFPECAEDAYSYADAIIEARGRRCQK